MTSDDRTCRINVRIGAACVELLDHLLSIPQSERAERMRLLATMGLNELRRPAAGAAPVVENVSAHGREEDQSTHSLASRARAKRNLLAEPRITGQAPHAP